MKTSAAPVQKPVAAIPPSESVGDPWILAVVLVLVQRHKSSDSGSRKRLFVNWWISCYERRIGTLWRRSHFSWPPVRERAALEGVFPSRKSPFLAGRGVAGGAGRKYV